MAKENETITETTLRGIIADRDKALELLQAKLEQAQETIKNGIIRTDDVCSKVLLVDRDDTIVELRSNLKVITEDRDELLDKLKTARAPSYDLDKPHLRGHVPSLDAQDVIVDFSHVRKLGTPYEESRRAFNQYAGMAANELPANPVAALQVMLHRWEAREFQGGGSVVDSTLGVNEETGELSEAFIYLAAMQCGAGRMAHAVLKRKQGIRGFEDPEVYKQAAADAIADVAIFAMQCATKTRLDFWAIVEETAVQVMDRKWKGE